MSLIAWSVGFRGTVEDTELVDGIIIDRRVESLCNVFCVEDAKIGFIQFCIAPPKAEVIGY